MKILKTTAVLAAAAAMSVTANAADLSKITTVWNSLAASSNSSYYVDGGTVSVSSPEQWESAISNAAQRLCGEITLNITDFDNDAYNIKKLSAYDYVVSAKGSVLGSTAEITYTITYSSNYKLRRAYQDSSLIYMLNTEELYAYNFIIQKTNELTAGLTSDYDKELAIHDYIISTYKYGGISDNGSVPLRAHEAAAFITDGEGVCEAYAELFYNMAVYAGLEADFVTGTLDGVAHIWNIIKLDGEYYHVDCTGDDPSPDEEGRTRYTYFNVTTDMILKDHTIDSTDGVVCTAEKYNYYTYNNYIVHNADELYEFISDQYDSGKRTITFRTEGYTINSSTIIKNVLAEKGCKSFKLSGEYGVDDIFTVMVS